MDSLNRKEKGFSIQKIKTQPFKDQNPGTSGLRKKTEQFKSTPNYLENYIQSIVNALEVSSLDKQNIVIIGGDGRFFNDTAIQKTIAILLANQFSNLWIAQHGLMSTPAASHLIIKHQASFAINFSASHNPAGINGDTGIKLNLSDGAPASTEVTNKIYQASLNIKEYNIVDISPIDLNHCKKISYQQQNITIFNAVTDYVELMKSLFDFSQLKRYLRTNRFCFDAMNAVTGPYAKTIFCDELGICESDIFRSTPLKDFGGIHPDPNPQSANELYQLALGNDCPYELLAASDADGDRNMILGKGIFVHPCDSLALMLKHAQYLPIKQNLNGVARSFVSSRAVDCVADSVGINCYQVPTGWKFFNNLLSSQRINLCGEESFGTSGNHIKEKDGIWSVLCWLSILANTEQPLKVIMANYWKKYGRHYYARYDFEDLSNAEVKALMEHAPKKIEKIPKFNHHKATQAQHFSYLDPVTSEQLSDQGYEVTFGDTARFSVRVSGTGTAGATLRIYTEVYHQNDNLNSLTLLNPLAQLAMQIIQLKKHCNIEKPSHIV